MRDATELSNHFTFGPEPTGQEFDQLVHEGFKTVVSFKTNGEEHHAAEIKTEARRAHDLGLQFLHLSVAVQSLTETLADEFQNRINKLPKPVYAYPGERAGAMLAIHLAVEEGLTGDPALEWVRGRGFEPQDERIKEFIFKYTRRNHKLF